MSIIKKIKFKILLLAYSMLFFTCNKDDNTVDTDTNSQIIEGKIQGTIILPQGSIVNINTLKVISPIAEASVKNGKFIIDTINYSSNIVQNLNGQPLMMSYNYPGNDFHEINSNTTALGMLMNTPAILNIKKEFKIDVIKIILSDPSFNALVLEVEKLIKEGKSFSEVDSTNLEYKRAFTKLFTNVAAKRPEYLINEPILVQKGGKLVSFTNNAMAPYHSIGIYQDGQLKKSLTIDGMKIFATSLWDLYNGIFKSTSSPDSKTYELTADGEYIFKIRSGRPGNNDVSKESIEALKINVKSIIYDNILELLPIDEASCFNQVLSNIESYIETVFKVSDINRDPSASELNKLASILLGVTEQIINNSSELVKVCGKIKNPVPTNNYLKLAGSWFKWLSIIGISANVTAHIFQWAMAKPSIDTCFVVNGNEVTFCSDSTQIYQASLSGSWKYDFYANGPYGWKLLITENYTVNNKGDVFLLKEINHDQIDQFGTIYPGKSISYDPPVGKTQWLVKRKIDGSYTVDMYQYPRAFRLNYPVASMVYQSDTSSVYGSKHIYTKE